MSPRSWWGWGDEERHLDRAALRGLSAALAERFDLPAAQPDDPVRVTDLAIPAPRVRPPAALASLCSDEPRDRARHAHGCAYRDVVRAFRGDLSSFPDLVVRPGGVEEVRAVLEWCSAESIACVPFGGGTSVVGGVDPPEGPAVSLDLERLGGVLEVDRTSRAAHVAAGTTGPQLEDGLRPHGLTLRFFPQSWEHSTVGGWLATRAAGHFATGPTHVDDLVEAVTAETPAGTWRSRRLPASGAGPSPDRILLGSEGTLGVITDAWLRVLPRPAFRADADVRFGSFAAGCDAVRALAQSDLRPANCRLLDPVEAAMSGAGDGTVLLLGFESADHPVRPWIDRALELAADHGGRCRDGARYRDGASGGAGGAGATWREAFLQAPYLRDALVALGVVVETFETAITWDRLGAFLGAVVEATRSAAEQVCGRAEIAVRLTHAYPDGAAPYLTVVAPGRRGSEVAQWDAIKAAASEAIIAAGGTITHHHAVGRVHRPWYDRQRPDLFARALSAVKEVVDPAAVMNPGVLLPEPPTPPIG